MVMKFVTWNNHNLESMQKAEKRKWALECQGYALIHSSVGCLTYEKRVEESCECGITEDGVWSEELFDEAGCTCT